ncbi:MAG: DUF4244 domain-containing protein [Actinobacteria bacterium]|nr:DUF4244 domain-containing protein [Actinomycetota bacterium]
MSIHSALTDRFRTLARPHRRQAGQATAEYALVLVAAATIAVLLIAWASSSGRIGKLFDAVFNVLQGKVR